MTTPEKTGPRAVHETLTLDDDISVLLVRAANKLTAHSSRHLRSRYGIGSIEWRMLVMLTLEPDIPASRATEAVGFDKAAVSRALSTLKDRGLVTATESRRDPRRKTWALLPAGEALHAEILVWARERDEAMLSDVPADDLQRVTVALRSISHYFEASVDALPVDDQSADNAIQTATPKSRTPKTRL